MGVEGAFFRVLAVGAVGLALSVGIERFLVPRPFLIRPKEAWGAHVALWCAVYTPLVLLMDRPWCALAATSAMLVTLVLVSNAKYKSLREPFLFHDYDYFLDAIRYPRLFLPFLGLKSFCLAAVFFILALLGFLYEQPPARFTPYDQLGGELALLTAAALLLWKVKRRPLTIGVDPEKDLQKLGLLPALWAYAAASQTLPEAQSPFLRVSASKGHSLPHLIAIQSESFFDARTLFTGIRQDVLQSFDMMRKEAEIHGPLTVPAWGANTVRTEFSFLTGIAAQRMGVHRFNPYQTVARGWKVQALPLFLKRLGYRTVCIHPSWAHFYGRDRVLRQLGFDAFLDISAFDGAQRAGSYVSDKEVGQRIMRVLQTTACPTFIFAVTMENHGPLHMDPLRLEGAPDVYSFPPPDGCDDLGTYLRHVSNADGMLHLLHTALQQADFPASLCFYGDHVPIMPSVYKKLTEPTGRVPYLCWNNQYARNMNLHNRETGPSAKDMDGTERPLDVHDLALTWLHTMNLTTTCC